MKRFMVVGAAGLTWPEAARQADQNSGLGALVRRGAAGRLSGRPPYDGPAPWASMVTGVQPERHGVFRAQEAWAGGLRPVSQASWRTDPLWRTLALRGLRTASVAWPASRPGDAWAGDHIDESVMRASGHDARHWALPPHGCPRDRREMVRGARLHPSEVGATLLAPLVPELAEIDQQRDPSLAQLAVMIAEAATAHSIAMALASERSWDVLFVHYNWLQKIAVRFRARPAPLDQVLPAAARLQDMMLRHLVQAAGDEVLILVASAAASGRAGIFVAAGPGIAPGTTIAGADLLDVAPTVLACFDLVDDSLTGKTILSGSGMDAKPITTVQRPDAAEQPPTDTAHLVEAGYRLPPGPSAAWRGEGLTVLGHILLPRAPAEAEKAACAALRIRPGDPGALALRAAALIALGEADPLPELAKALEAAAPESGWGPLVHGAHHVLRGEAQAARPWLLSVEARGPVEMRLRAGAAWLRLQRPFDAERVFKAVLADQPSDIPAALGLSMAAVQRRDFIGAEISINRVLAQDPGNLAGYLQLYALKRTMGLRNDVARLERVCVELGATPQDLAWAVSGFGLYLSDSDLAASGSSGAADARPGDARRAPDPAG